ncbi:GNAT family N-acetyltransferase [Bacillus badius]|uniref:GNAT family N-acetyltransferase n=1 Tax=Bacillus badius TaxID=1455 RepID=UPI000596CCEE|nr:GNAT family N-acetyltransferase [Bacillus badius]
MKYSIDVSLENNEKFSTFLNTKIREFNNEHSIHHKNVRKKGSVQPINIIVTDDEGRWIGGITAETYWNWLEINDFWFEEKFRGKGLGSSLLSKLEQIGLIKGATQVLLTTFKFQARSFYELHGYKVVGEVKDYPPGSSYYTMVKSLK